MQAKVVITMSVNEAIVVKRALTGERDRLMQTIKSMHASDGKSLREEAGRINDLLLRFNTTA